MLFETLVKFSATIFSSINIRHNLVTAAQVQYVGQARAESSFDAFDTSLEAVHSGEARSSMQSSDLPMSALDPPMHELRVFFFLSHRHGPVDCFLPSLTPARGLVGLVGWLVGRAHPQHPWLLGVRVAYVP